ncbi:MAG: hypothetical protein ACI865_002445 [Flavobacteriaceae bacterium]|jgi:hypothetical protein
MFDPFNILGRWKLTSEKSDELLRFLGDGTYCVYFQNPFRMIEIGNWSIRNGDLIMLASNVELSSSIIYLDAKLLSLNYPYENEKKVLHTYAKLDELF